MSVPELFIRRPVMTTLVMLAILLFGALGYRALPVSDLPSVDYPSISVSRVCRAQTLTDGFIRGHARSKNNSHHRGAWTRCLRSVRREFANHDSVFLEPKHDAAGQDVQAAIARAARQLPRTCRRATYFKVNSADQPVIFMAMSSPTLPLSTVDDYAETLVAQRISMINGVAQVGVMGCSSTPCACNLTRTNWPLTASALTK